MPVLVAGIPWYRTHQRRGRVAVTPESMATYPPTTWNGLVYPVSVAVHFKKQFTRNPKGKVLRWYAGCCFERHVGCIPWVYTLSMAASLFYADYDQQGVQKKRFYTFNHQGIIDVFR